MLFLKNKIMYTMNLVFKLPVVFLVIMFAACDTYTQDDYTTDYVIESYLIAGEPLPELKLSETAPVDAIYEPDAYGVSGANAIVTLVAEDGRTEKSYVYVAARAGVYRAVDERARVLPSRRYTLHIDVPDAEPISASTFVPGALSIVAPANDTLYYQDDAIFTLRVNPSTYPGRQAIYVNNVRALDTTRALTALYQEFVEEDFVSRQELVENSSGIMNEENFQPQADGTLEMMLPWIGVAFYGPNEIVVNAVDDNLFDFLRFQEDNGTRPFGELENPVDHVENGRGIFGSLARAKVEVYVSGSRDN